MSEKIGSPPASNLDPPVFRSSARMELLSLSAIYATFKSSVKNVIIKNKHFKWWFKFFQVKYYNILPGDSETPEGCANDVFVELLQ